MNMIGDDERERRQEINYLAAEREDNQNRMLMAQAYGDDEADLEDYEDEIEDEPEDDFYDEKPEGEEPTPAQPQPIGHPMADENGIVPVGLRDDPPAKWFKNDPPARKAERAKAKKRAKSVRKIKRSVAKKSVRKAVCRKKSKKSNKR